MPEQMNAYETLTQEISLRSEESDPDYYYNDIGPLLYVFAATPKAEFSLPSLTA